jgi:branched-chain amino acid transport system substrate-binding protein
MSLLPAATAIAGCVFAGATARAAEPITIGFGMALTGGLAGAGKTALLAMQIWQDDINAKEGLLGRPVELVYYDDQTNPPTVPGIYTKLLDVDKVDMIVSGYGTNMIAPAMPIAIQHDRLFLGLLGLAVNSEFHYPKFFMMLPMGPNPKTYPPTTTDYTPIVHAIQATDPEIVFVASYPPDSAGMVRAATELGLKTRFFGGGMVGLQYTSVKQQFGAKLNGIHPQPLVQYDRWRNFLWQGWRMVEAARA